VNKEVILISKEFKEALNKKCPDDGVPCSFMFKIGENLQSFNGVIGVFTKYGFSIQEFVDENMCILSRESDGINEAVKISRDQVQIQAWKETIIELCDSLADYCKSYDQEI
jgi:hypothetical protein